MLGTNKLTFAAAVDALKATAEPTRLRLVLLLARNDLTVTDLTSILGQSQPRISRHLKLLVESGVVTRYQEGAWAYFRLSDEAVIGGMIRAVLLQIDHADPTVLRDTERLEHVRRRRAERAADYFAENAAEWDRIRSLHAPDAVVEKRLVEAVGEGPFDAMLDVGTGTGRLMELMAARCRRLVGVDASREMLSIARAKLDAANIHHALVRHGDVYHLPVERNAFDVVTIHQVLHFLDDPLAAIREAVTTLRPGGRLVIIDFAPHELEFLRDEHAHLRLGFSHETLSGYVEDAGLDLERIDDLDPGGTEPGQLTVTLLVARDSRLPQARAETPSLQFAAAL